MIIFLIAGGKLNAFTRIAPFIGLSKSGILMNAFFNSQFGYLPLIWMSNNTEINRFHEMCLRIIYNDKQLLFSVLLAKDGFVSIHVRNVQSIPAEMFLISRNLTTP